MNRTKLTTLAFALAAVAIAPADTGTARADSSELAPDDDFFSWDMLDGARYSDYEDAMHSGDRFASRAAIARRNRHFIDAHSAARRAVVEYERAIKAKPDAAEAHYRAAEVIYAHWVASDNRPNREFAERGIAHWAAWEKLAPRDPRLEAALFRRSIAYTKLGGDDNFRFALKDYERQLGLSTSAASSAANQATLVSNAAEIYMGVGDLNEAITLYKQALDLSNTALYAYGLALALQRDGQETKARQLMAQYAMSDRLNALHNDGVFFVPMGDIHAYKGLGYESLGFYRKASESYRLFLQAQPNGRYSALARERLKALDGKKDDPPADLRWGRRRW